jgi:hypothetical protein
LIKREVENKIRGHFGSGNGSNQARSYSADKKKAIPRVNDAASTQVGLGFDAGGKETIDEDKQKFPATR